MQRKYRGNNMVLERAIWTKYWLDRQALRYVPNQIVVLIPRYLVSDVLIEKSVKVICYDDIYGGGDDVSS